MSRRRIRRDMALYAALAWLQNALPCSVGSGIQQRIVQRHVDDIAMAEMFARVM